MESNKKILSKIPEEQINSVSDLFSILSNPARLKILWFLKKNKSSSVHRIHEELKISQSSVSQHLSLLKLHKLVIEERHGKEIHYKLTASKKISKVLASAIHLISYQLASSSEILSTYTELLSLLL